MAKGYTKTQREWFLEVYQSSCHFPTKDEKYCASSKFLQIHHFIPKRYYVVNIGHDPNIALNGIPLCSYHHIGIGYQGPLNWRNIYVPVLHPDITWAKKRYNSDHSIFEKVFEERNHRIEQGLTYWNTSFDSLLEEIINETVGTFLRRHPELAYPLTREQKENHKLYK